MSDVRKHGALIRHGTATGYKTHGCRCESCSLAGQQFRRTRYRADIEKARAQRRRWAQPQQSPPWDDHAKARQKITGAVRAGTIQRPDECDQCGNRPGRTAGGAALIQVWIADPSDPWTHDWLCSFCSAARRRGLPVLGAMP